MTREQDWQGEWSPNGQPLTRQFHRIVQRARALDRRRPWVWDTLLTGFYVTACLIDFMGGGWKNVTENLDTPAWLLGALSLGFSVPLFWRRSHPFAVLLVMLPFTVTNVWTGAVLQASMTLFVVIFNIALRTRLRTLLWSFALAAAPFWDLGFRYPGEEGPDATIVPVTMSLALCAVGGIAVRTRQEYLASLVERARQLEVERDQQAQLAAAAERTRIAREMHDIIGHNLSVITGLADGGSYAAAKSPERAAQALEAIGTTSRQALAELRRLLEVLREQAPTAELTPQPSLTDLDQLIAGVRSAGLPVRLKVHGRAAPVPAGTQLTVYRVIQEALTNTLKHAGPGATSQVSISYEEGGAVTVTVTDTGRGGPAPDGSPGRGLTGMRERTALYGGTLEAGPLPTGGWRIHLHLPTLPAPQDATPQETTSREATSQEAAPQEAVPKEAIQ
ncbi:sensor histidine kinase [Streptomyces montanus]|uniref:histidine kinase n=1 Tax=Streptomyces montanus TaxID=2580423 RepID=A0A5R9FDV3_9ACTN|nr:sensor histidine kinase [Streptomyces montanus]TLS40649.1 sensor histidine kinase [Streptomyces montanus]